MNPLEESIISNGHARANYISGSQSESASLLNIPGNIKGSLPNVAITNFRRDSSRLTPFSKKKRISFEDDLDFEPVDYNERIRINISGARFDIPEHILKKHPETLLGNPLRIKRFYDERRDEYFFNRNRKCFDSILQYYQNGILRRPHDIAMDTFVGEITFFELGKEALLQFCRDEGFEREAPEPLPTNPVFRRIWELVEIPQSSPAAKFFAILSTTIIILSIFVFCIETLPYFQHKEEILTDPVSVNRTVELTDGSSVHELSPDEVKIARGYSQFQEPIFIIESICIAWFTLEFITRLIVCPNKKLFLKSPMNIIDIIAIVPYYIDLGITLASISSGSSQERAIARSLAILRILRLVRVFRIFKLSRHSKGLQILGRTFMTSAQELGLLLLFLAIGVVLFSSAAFYAEQGYETSQFHSIPEGFWWAVVTMTTVGYGDIAPTGPLGKIVGTACAVSGLIAIALPVPVIVSNFNTIYQREKDRPQVEAILNDALSISDGLRSIKF